MEWREWLNGVKINQNSSCGQTIFCYLDYMKNLLAFIAFPYNIAFHGFLGLFDSYKPKQSFTFGDFLLYLIAGTSAVVQIAIALILWIIL